MSDESFWGTRRMMGTLPSESKKQTVFYRGVENIDVELIDYSQHPYRAIFDMATSTWGDEEYTEKYYHAEVQARKMVLEAALTHQTLPTCLEAPKFTWVVRGVSRSSFDQIARVRVGAGIGSMGVRDNNRLDAGFRMPRDLWDNKETRNEIHDYVLKGKDLYEKILGKGRTSWQSARSILPMGITHNFFITMNFLAFQQQCSKRLMFCEQPDTVAAFWLMRASLEEKFPVLAAYCRPGCDLAKKCIYHQQYTLSEYFSCLFQTCGRWSVIEERNSSFPYPSCTKEEIEGELRIKIPGPKDWTVIEHDAWKREGF